MLGSLGAKKKYMLDEIPGYYGITNIKSLAKDVKNLLSDTKFNLLIHPCSKGNAREWGMDNYQKLLDILPKDKFRIFITGTKEEGAILNPYLFDNHPGVIDMTGKLKLENLVSFIAHADGMLSASTGPLHIAAALGKHALGLYAPMRPIHPGRWAPIGVNASFFGKG